MKVYRVVKHVKAENMYDAISKERNFHPHEIEEISNDNQPMGYGTEDELR
jgi:flagellar biosynthesis regulator FlbT